MSPPFQYLLGTTHFTPKFTLSSRPIIYFIVPRLFVSSFAPFKNLSAELSSRRTQFTHVMQNKYPYFTQPKTIRYRPPRLLPIPAYRETVNFRLVHGPSLFSFSHCPYDSTIGQDTDSSLHDKMSPQSAATQITAPKAYFGLHALQSLLSASIHIHSRTFKSQFLYHCSRRLSFNSIKRCASAPILRRAPLRECSPIIFLHPLVT